MEFFMGLIKCLKNIFNKNIECGNEIDDHMVFLLKKKYLYLNKNIYVREKNACVVVYRGRVCDVIFNGKYRINQESIPETYGKAKIERRQAKGKKIRRIRADIYYVNLETFNQFKYISNIPFKSKSSSLGKIKGFLAGTCSIKCLDPKCLIKNLIAGNGKIKNKFIYDRIGLIVGNKINKLVVKNKVVADMVFNNQEYIERVLNTDMQDALDRVGLFVSNVKLKAVDFSKKYQKYN
jgi:membrane protease subunit (stomatin/prohibitin family)